MAQYRRTTNSLGGPTRIADPGADELARMLALRLQQQQQAQQQAGEQAKLSLEEKLAGERMRREDTRLDLERAAQQQQQALADRSYGLQERQFGETVRGNRASEGREVNRDTLAAELGRAGITLQKDDLGFRKAEAGNRRTDEGLDRTQRGELAANQIRSSEKLSENELAARFADRSADREDSKLARNDAWSRFVLDDVHQKQRDETDYARRQVDLTRALGEQAKSEERAQGQSRAAAGFNAITDVEGQPVSFEIEDPGMFDPYHRLNPNRDLAVERIRQGLKNYGMADPAEYAEQKAREMTAQLASVKATTEEDLLRAAQLIVQQIQADFVARRIGEQRDLGLDNSEFQNEVERLAIKRFRENYERFSGALSGAPGAEATKRPPGYVKPAGR